SGLRRSTALRGAPRDGVPVSTSRRRSFRREGTGRVYAILPSTFSRSRWRAGYQSVALGTRIYSITSSASASIAGGTTSPGVFAVLTLIASSNLVGCSIWDVGRLHALENLHHLSADLTKNRQDSRSIARERAF